MPRFKRADEIWIDELHELFFSLFGDCSAMDEKGIEDCVHDIRLHVKEGERQGLAAEYPYLRAIFERL